MLKNRALQEKPSNRHAKTQIFDSSHSCHNHRLMGKKVAKASQVEKLRGNIGNKKQKMAILNCLFMPNYAQLRPNGGTFTTIFSGKLTTKSPVPTCT